MIRSTRLGRWYSASRTAANGVAEDAAEDALDITAVGDDSLPLVEAGLHVRHVRSDRKRSVPAQHAFVTCCVSASAPFAVRRDARMTPGPRAAQVTT